MKFNDYELIYLVREQNEEALMLISNQYAPFIGKLASSYSYYNKSSEYEDYFQVGHAAFIKAIYSYNELSAVSFYTYCMACCKNAMISYYKKLKRYKRIEHQYSINADEDYEVSEQLHHQYESKLDEVIYQRMMIEQHLKDESVLLTKLEKSCLKCLMKGHNYNEIATILSLPSKKVENAITRCRVKLKKEVTNI